MPAPGKVKKYFSTIRHEEGDVAAGNPANYGAPILNKRTV
jgi:hypothetical protein